MPLGEVQVHRLHWQKVWNLLPPKENVTVDSMAWRPDGKVIEILNKLYLYKYIYFNYYNCFCDCALQALAIGYSNGTVCIVDIETKEVLDKYDFAYDVTEEFYSASNYGIPCITWAVKSGTLESAIDYNIYVC